MTAEGSHAERPEIPTRECVRLLKPVWISREQARTLRDKHPAPSRIDFWGVEIATSPFLDEYLGQMMEDCRDRGLEQPELLNVSDEVRVSIELVLEGRGIDYKFPAEAAS